MSGRLEHFMLFIIFCFGVNQSSVAFFQEERSLSLNQKGKIDRLISDYTKTTTDSVIKSPSKRKIVFSKERNDNYSIPFKEIQVRYISKDVTKYTRIEQGNSVSTDTYAINNQFQPSTLANMVSFNLFDKGLNIHTFSGTQSTMYPLNFTFVNTVNTRLEVYGFEYRFRSKETKPFRYSLRGRTERDNRGDTYYQLGLNAFWKKERQHYNLGVEYFPVRNGPAHILKIYRTQLASSLEFLWNTNLKQIALFESNYYSDQQIDVAISTRTEYNFSATSNFEISPLIELGYSRGTVNRRDSYPYWMAEKRLFGGGGVAFVLGSNTSKFQMIADASLFGEMNQASFERYTGNLSYRIQNFTTLHAGFEVYTIENFYSNVAQLGMVYNFK